MKIFFWWRRFLARRILVEAHFNGGIFSGDAVMVEVPFDEGNFLVELHFSRSEFLTVTLFWRKRV